MIINGRGVNQFTVPMPKLEPSYELSYLLGVLKGDGCIYKSRNEKNKTCIVYIIQLRVIDKEFIEYFAEVLEKIFGRKVKIGTYLDDRSKLFYRVSIHSKSFYEWYNSKIEEEIFKIARFFPNAFIKGMFDSEGNLTYFKSRDNSYPVVRICSSNHSLIRTVKEWLEEFYQIIGIIKMVPSTERTINGRICKFKKDVYVLGIYKQGYVRKFYKSIGTSISRKNMEVE